MQRRKSSYSYSIGNRTWNWSIAGRLPEVSHCHHHQRCWSWKVRRSALPEVGFMLFAGLRARRTTLFVRTTPPSNFSTRRLGRWPFRRAGQPPPLRPSGTGARPLAAYSIAIAFGAGVGFVAYEKYQPFRHTVLAVVRCSRVAGE